MVGQTIIITPEDKKRIIRRQEEEPIVEVKVGKDLYKGKIIKISSSGRYEIKLLEKI